MNGKKFMVVPTVMMVPGVLNGSGGPMLYTAEELAKFAQAWNGRPVTLGHPRAGEAFTSANDSPQRMVEHVGTVQNTNFADGKLRAELWIDEQKAKQAWPGIENAIKDKMEVSTGLFADSIPAQGNWNGKSFEQVAQHIRPDHLSLLPDSPGACDWSMGCGVRANEQQTREVSKMTQAPIGFPTVNGEYYDPCKQETKQKPQPQATVNRNQQQQPIGIVGSDYKFYANPCEAPQERGVTNG